MSMKALKAAAEAATKKLGAELVGKMCVTFGSCNFTVDDVPADRQEGLTAALHKLASGGKDGLAFASAAFAGNKPAVPARKRTAADAWQDIEDEAGYKAADVKAVAEGTTLADLHAAAYAKWNRKNNA